MKKLFLISVLAALSLVGTTNAANSPTVLAKSKSNRSLVFVNTWIEAKAIDIDDQGNTIYAPIPYTQFGFRASTTKIGQKLKLQWTMTCQKKVGATTTELERKGTLTGRTQISSWQSPTVAQPDMCVFQVIGDRPYHSKGFLTVSVLGR